jgi:hypothetical protein
MFGPWTPTPFKQNNMAGHFVLFVSTKNITNRMFVIDNVCHVPDIVIPSENLADNLF